MQWFLFIIYKFCEFNMNGFLILLIFKKNIRMELTGK